MVFYVLMINEYSDANRALPAQQEVADSGKLSATSEKTSIGEGEGSSKEAGWPDSRCA